MGCGRGRLENRLKRFKIITFSGKPTLQPKKNAKNKNALLNWNGQGQGAAQYFSATQSASARMFGAIEAMIAKGVDLDKPNDEGKSPRTYAEELGDEKVLSVLGS